MADTILCYVAIPGPPGPPGAAGTNGTNGTNAFVLTTAPFNLPAEGGTVVINVTSSAPFVAGQVVVVEVGGAFAYMEVSSIPSGTSLLLFNLENTANSLYIDNSPPGTPFATGAKVSPGGMQGPGGGSSTTGAPTTASYILQTFNASLPSAQTLSGLATGLLKNATGTGILTIAVQGTDYYRPSGTDVAIADGGTGASSIVGAVANLGLVIGSNIQAYSANLQALSALSPTANSVPYFTSPTTASLMTVSSAARDLLDDTSYAGMRSTLGLLTNYGLLGIIPSINMNLVGDNLLNIPNTRYRIDKIVIENASASLSLATLGVFTSAGGSGTSIAGDQSLTALTAPIKFVDMTLEPIVSTDVLTVNTLYVRVGTAQGSAATARLLLFGWDYA